MSTRRLISAVWAWFWPLWPGSMTTVRPARPVNATAGGEDGGGAGFAGAGAGVWVGGGVGVGLDGGLGLGLAVGVGVAEAAGLGLWAETVRRGEAPEQAPGATNGPRSALAPPRAGD